MGITQGRTLLSSLNLSFRSTSHGQHRDPGHVSRGLDPSAEEGYCLRCGLETNPLEFEPNLPHQGHALDAEKVLVHGLFKPSADVSPLIPSGTASRTADVCSLLPALKRRRERQSLSLPADCVTLVRLLKPKRPDRHGTIRVVVF